MARIRIGLGIAILVIIGVFVGGCEEGQAGSTNSRQANLPENVKMQRLYAAENEQIKSENEKLKGQLEQLNQQLAKCEKDRQAWQDKAQIEIKENVEGILKTSLEQNVEMNKEIERLQEELAKLKGQTSTEQQPAPERTEKQNEPNANEAKTGLPL